MSRRRWWQRRTRQRQLGYAFYLAAAALLVAGVFVVATRNADGDDEVVSSVTAPTSARVMGAVTTVAPIRPVDPDTAVNSTPVLHAPAEVDVARTGVTPVEGLSVDDIEAAAGDETVGVLIYTSTGIIHLQRTVGVQLLQANPSAYIPFIGRLSAVNAALATVGYESKSSASRQEIRIIVSDFGGVARQPSRSTEKRVQVRVS